MSLPPLKMDKFCIFCGLSPQDKNREHVLPQWLIKMTGDPKRIATFGIDFSKPPFRFRQFSFDSLTFPACSQCNETFGKLETATEPIVRRLTEHQPVSANDLIVLLDWLDKVRIGLWLGFFYLDKNFAGIVPRFHIKSRLGRSDRMVGIIRLADSPPGLTFSGTDSKFYQLSPTCLGLGVKGLYFINAAGISLCSQRLGFPFAQPVRFREDHNMEVSLNCGSERIRYPVERSTPLPNIVSIYQPVFKTLLDSEDGAKYLENNWVAKHTADFERGYGKVFIQKNAAICLYSDDNSLDWVPSQSWKTWEFVNRVPEYIYGRLCRDFENNISIFSSKYDRKHLREQATMAKMLDRAMLQRIRESAVRMKAMS